MVATAPLPVSQVRYVPELYPRLQPSDETISRYQETLDDLPPIVVARGGALVDGYHRWQAHLRSGRPEIPVVDLGDISDNEIIIESVERNVGHGLALSRDDKRKLAQRLWPTRIDLKDSERIKYFAQLLAASPDSVRGWTKDARDQEKQERQDRAWDEWLNCRSQKDIAAELGIGEATLSEWFGNRKDPKTESPPDPHMAFDYWSYGKYDGDNSRFGKLHPGVVENLLWLFTEPGQIVVDPFAGAGTTIHAAKAMGRRVWASDRSSAEHYPTLPIHTHDITIGWPDGAPNRADLILLDPPYWQQARGRYSDDPNDLANMTLSDFYDAWAKVIKLCADHLSDAGRLAYIVSPTQLEDGGTVDHATDMLRICWDQGLQIERRIIVPYSTQQATGQQVTWARNNKRLLKLYRDLVVLKP